MSYGEDFHLEADYEDRYGYPEDSSADDPDYFGDDEDYDDE